MLFNHQLESKTLLKPENSVLTVLASESRDMFKPLPTVDEFVRKTDFPRCILTGFAECLSKLQLCIKAQSPTKENLSYTKFIPKVKISVEFKIKCVYLPKLIQHLTCFCACSSVEQVLSNFSSFSRFTFFAKILHPQKSEGSAGPGSARDDNSQHGATRCLYCGGRAGSLGKIHAGILQFESGKIKFLSVLLLVCLCLSCGATIHKVLLNR